MCVLGTALPFSQFIPWVLDNGIDIQLLLAEISNDKLSAFAWLDVIVSAVALIGFILWDSTKHTIKYAWCSILGTCCVGVSLGLPLYLLTREIQKKNGL